MNIKHHPIFNRDQIIEHYSTKDGVEIKYVCTSALGSEEFAMDIFYRETPHPEFGNRYFGLYTRPYRDDVMITNADAIEDVSFAMAEDFDGNLEYSQHRHDYRVLANNRMIDGGRAYVRTNGPVQYYKVKNGEFVSE